MEEPGRWKQALETWSRAILIRSGCMMNICHNVCQSVPVPLNSTLNINTLLRQGLECTELTQIIHLMLCSFRLLYLDLYWIIQLLSFIDIMMICLCNDVHA